MKGQLADTCIYHGQSCTPFYILQGLTELLDCKFELDENVCMCIYTKAKHTHTHKYTLFIPRREDGTWHRLYSVNR